MADDKSSIFTEKAQDKLRSPDDLDEYVRVTNPSIWVVLAACAVLLVSLFAWGLLGTAGFAEGVPLSATITVENVAPMSLVFKDAA